jgi:hypothetical protein
MYPDIGQPNERGSMRIRIHHTGLNSQIPYLSFLSCLKGEKGKDSTFHTRYVKVREGPFSCIPSPGELFPSHFPQENRERAERA